MGRLLHHSLLHQRGQTLFLPHDAAGNVTRIERDGRPTLGLAWNSQYQLVSVSTNGVFAESYTYDALSRRVSTTTLEGTTRHVYDNNWQCIADIDENGSVVASYVWGEGIDNLLAVNIGGATYYPLTDIQGTVWGYVDEYNNIVARWTYDAWGNVLSEYIAPSASVLAQIRYRFQGREWSAATGLVNFRMRWYDAETGRWLSKDPIGLSGGLNLYAFCGGDPMSFIDPGGLDKDANNKSNSPVPAGKLGPPRRGPSGNTYRADPLGHGTKPGTSDPKDPHIHQTDSRGRTRIFDLDGKPRDKGSKLPKVDIPAFGKAVWDAMKYIRMPLPILLMPPVLDMPPGNLS